MPPIANQGRAAPACARRAPAGPGRSPGGPAWSAWSTAARRRSSRRPGSAAAASACAGLWLLRPMSGPGPRMRRATGTGRSSWPRWSTSAPAASATSARSFTASRRPCRRQAPREHLEQREFLARLQALLPQLHDVHPGAEHGVEEPRQVTLAPPGVRAQVEPRVRQPRPQVTAHRRHPITARRPGRLAALRPCYMVNIRRHSDHGSPPG